MLNKGLVSVNSKKIEEIVQSKGLKKNWIAREAGINIATLTKTLRRGYGRRSTVKLLAIALGVSDEDIAA